MQHYIVYEHDNNQHRNIPVKEMRKTSSKSLDPEIPDRRSHTPSGLIHHVGVVGRRECIRSPGYRPGPLWLLDFISRDDGGEDLFNHDHRRTSKFTALGGGTLSCSSHLGEGGSDHTEF